jgi:chemotaxis protein MotB
MKRITNLLGIIIVLLLWALFHFYNKAMEADNLPQTLQLQVTTLEQENSRLKDQVQACSDKSGAMETISKAQAEIVQLTQRMAGLEKERDSLKKELKDAVSNLSEAKQKELADAQATHAKLTEEMKKDIDQGRVQISRLSDQLSLTLVDQILFPSGGVRLSAEGTKLLQELADRLKENPSKIIRVIGHTDDLPPSGHLQSKFADNWALSSARAVNVVRYLEQRGIEARHMQAVGLGASRPLNDNSTEQGRSKNRRIEIVLANPEASEN